MKLFYSFLFVCSVCFSQGNNNVLKISYNASSKHFNNWKNAEVEEHILLINGNNAIYQSSINMKIDSLKATNKFSAASSPYFTYNTYALEIEGNNLTYYNTIFRDEYQYEETLDFKWQLSDEIKMVNGYSCKMATVNYGNRDWIAWYTQEIPISFGPYKFGGLPGLIIKLYDDTYSFQFDVQEIDKIPPVPLKKLYHKKSLNERIVTSHDQFHSLLIEFNSLNVNDRLNFNNTGRPIQVNLSRVDSDSDKKKMREPSLHKNINFIEMINEN